MPITWMCECLTVNTVRPPTSLDQALQRAGLVSFANRCSFCQRQFLKKNALWMQIDGVDVWFSRKLRWLDYLRR